mmetsp:Transcript_61706/g.191134  ORF Transcript_61706/g.191134 Transcript_61706/m.191134 type:complete len:243 (-) Transcript_61706:49-777(-)
MALWLSGSTVRHSVPYILKSSCALASARPRPCCNHPKKSLRASLRQTASGSFPSDEPNKEAKSEVIDAITKQPSLFSLRDISCMPDSSGKGRGFPTSSALLGGYCRSPASTMPNRYWTSPSAVWKQAWCAYTLTWWSWLSLRVTCIMPPSSAPVSGSALEPRSASTSCSDSEARKSQKLRPATRRRKRSASSEGQGPTTCIVGPRRTRLSHRRPRIRAIAEACWSICPRCLATVRCASQSLR